MQGLHPFKAGNINKKASHPVSETIEWTYAEIACKVLPVLAGSTMILRLFTGPDIGDISESEPKKDYRHGSKAEHQ